MLPAPIPPIRWVLQKAALLVPVGTRLRRIGVAVVDYARRRRP